MALVGCADYLGRKRYDSVDMRLAWDAQAKPDRNDGKYHRERSDDLYHSARWTKVSRAWRAAHPLCEECRRNGVLKAGEVTDHIIPFPVCKDFFDDKNFQTLCQDCNNKKGQRDKKIIQEWRNNNGAKV